MLKSIFQFIILLTLAGLVKGGLHIVRIIILAGLGLAGMWMLHKLAQDYDKISTNFQSAFGKRSADYAYYESDIPGFPKLKWESVLAQDPEKCVPSLICQLAAIPNENLGKSERSILNLIRSTTEKNTRASKIVREALRKGENSVSTSQCLKYYPSCPYTSTKMFTLLQTYGGTNT